MIRYWNGILFAILWTLVMIALAWPVSTAKAAILAVCGAMAGAAFHLMMGWFTERQTRGS
jgi:phosphate/sulfate permease